jgi:hypothetical protein
LEVDMKNGRFVATLVATLVFGVAADSAHAARNAAAGPSSFPVAFTITSAQCSSVPAGADVQATGFQTNVTNRHATGGVLRDIVTSHAYGTATDPLGNTYVWSYSFQQNTTSSDGQNWAGRAVDHFSLTGNGPVHIVAGFTGSITLVGSAITSITPSNVVGDPIGFDDLSAHCDPL